MAERYRQTARNPLVPGGDVEHLLASLNHLIDVATPDPAIGPTSYSLSRSPDEQPRVPSVLLRINIGEPPRR